MDAPLKVKTFGVMSADDHSPKVFGLFSNRGFTALAGASFCAKPRLFASEEHRFHNVDEI